MQGAGAGAAACARSRSYAAVWQARCGLVPGEPGLVGSATGVLGTERNSAAGGGAGSDGLAGDDEHGRHYVGKTYHCRSRRNAVSEFRICHADLGVRVKPETGWNGRTRLLFGQMYEDTGVERSVFAPGSRVFCIASAGCTAIALSAEHAVTAVDLNPAQLEYARGRAAGLPPRWGLLDGLMRAERQALVLAGWSAARLERFLQFDSCAEQLDYWRTHLNTWPFRAAFDSKIAFASLGLRLFTRDQRLPLLTFGSTLRRRLARGLARHANKSNPYARLWFGRGLTTGQSAASTIRFETANAVHFLRAQPTNSYDAFSLSNIADAAGPAFRSELVEAVRHAASRDAMVVLRSFGEAANAAEVGWAAKDRAMLWGSIQVAAARELR